VAPLRVVEDGIDWGTLVPTTQKQEWVEKRLAAGQLVDMVVPGVFDFRWYQRKYSPSLSIQPDRTNRGVKVANPGSGLLELVSKPPAAGYDLEAQIIHRDHSGPSAVVGIFFGYTATPRGSSIDSFLRWTFNDLDDNSPVRAKTQLPPGRLLPDGNQVKLQAILFDKVKRDAVNDAWLRERQWQDYFIPACRTGKGVPPPRRLGVVVRPDGVTVSFDGNPTGHVSRATIDDQFLAAWNRVRPPAGQAPTFDPAGSLGVWVQSSTAVIQWFRVIPHSQE
jgi:hypothetical protein